jgi:hypothetical protein
MVAKRNKAGLVRGPIRWAARVLSIVSTVLLLLFLLGSREQFDLTRISAREWLGLLFFPFGVIVGFAIAWWREGLGGSLTILSLLAFYVFYGWLVRGGFLGWWFLVFGFPGLLFLASYALSQYRPD